MMGGDDVLHGIRLFDDRGEGATVGEGRQICQQFGRRRAAEESNATFWLSFSVVQTDTAGDIHLGVVHTVLEGTGRWLAVRTDLEGRAAVGLAEAASFFCPFSVDARTNIGEHKLHTSAIAAPTPQIGRSHLTC